MYTDTARALRCCQATKANGQPCRGFALWGGSRCAAHTHTTRRRSGTTLDLHYPTNYEPCWCVAYAWPHRPAGGLCCWPDVPAYRSTVPAGTNAQPRTGAKAKALIKVLKRYGW